MHRSVALMALVLTTSAPVRAADDPLARARLLYNQRAYEAAVTAAEEARANPARADAADLVAARAYLERFRASAASDDLTNARDRLRRLDPQRFPRRARRAISRPRGTRRKPAGSDPRWRATGATRFAPISIAWSFAPSFPTARKPRRNRPTRCAPSGNSSRSGGRDSGYGRSGDRV